MVWEIFQLEYSEQATLEGEEIVFGSQFTKT